jgi:cyclic pyranopterin phosphate synthase
MNEDQFLTLEEYENILPELKDLGVEEIRITGGEPLLNPRFKEITSIISRFGFKKIGLTTNGILLERFIHFLKEKKVFSLNISLDSLEDRTFKKITHTDQLQLILKNIKNATSLGFQVKINMVVMKGINDHEILNFVDFASSEGIEVRFLELMRIGYACKIQEDNFISSKDVMEVIESKYQLKKITDSYDSTSKNFVTNNGAVIGFISSESQPFCGNCSRWRLSAEGMLKSCLLKEDGISLKNLTKQERMQVYQESLHMKPYRRPFEVAHIMNTIGG